MPRHDPSLVVLLRPLHVLVLVLVVALPAAAVSAQAVPFVVPLEIRDASIRILDDAGRVVLERDLVPADGAREAAVALEARDRYRVELEVGTRDELGPIEVYRIRVPRDATALRLEPSVAGWDDDRWLRAVELHVDRASAPPAWLEPDGTFVRVHNTGTRPVVVPLRISRVYLDESTPEGWSTIGRVPGSADWCGTGGWGSVVIPPGASSWIDVDSEHVAPIAAEESGVFRLRTAVEEIVTEGTVSDGVDARRRPRLRRIDRYEIVRTLTLTALRDWVAGVDAPATDREIDGLFGDEYWLPSRW